MEPCWVYILRSPEIRCLRREIVKDVQIIARLSGLWASSVLIRLYRQAIRGLEGRIWRERRNDRLAVMGGRSVVEDVQQ